MNASLISRLLANLSLPSPVKDKHQIAPLELFPLTGNRWMFVTGWFKDMDRGSLTWPVMVPLTYLKEGCSLNQTEDPLSSASFSCRGGVNVSLKQAAQSVTCFLSACILRHSDRPQSEMMTDVRTEKQRTKNESSPQPWALAECWHISTHPRHTEGKRVLTCQTGSRLSDSTVPILPQPLMYLYHAVCARACSCVIGITLSGCDLCCAVCVCQTRSRRDMQALVSPVIYCTLKHVRNL